MGEDVDDRIGKMLDKLQPRVRQRSGYKSNYIALNYDKLERAHRELGYSYKDLAELLTNEGRPTKVPTLKYNMKKIAAQRQGEAPRTDRVITPGQNKRTATQPKNATTFRTDSPTAEVENIGTPKATSGERKRVTLASVKAASKTSAGTIRKFSR